MSRPFPAHISEEDLLRLQSEGWTQTKIALTYQITKQAVSDRYAALEARKARTEAKTMLVMERVNLEARKVWDLQTLHEVNVKRTLELLGTPLSVRDEIAVCSLLLKQQEYALKLVLLLHSVENSKAFQEGVLAALGEASPELKARALELIRRKSVLHRTTFESSKE